MLIERIENNQIKITLSSGIEPFGFQRLIEYVNYLEATEESKATQADVDQLADEVNESWWSKNKSRFTK
ncbi:hypothetical protein [Arcticibacter eurypsychrophilus]|uniref:hypothetical protein n=1 Tax=Arcticibacter eurypsychrophilus TaxID=1434752 RepID=UPI00084D497B|nr:hypothetical protein [Arcticibacter eurypsychrophilus]